MNDTYISELDTKRFGFKVAKVNEFLLSPSKIIDELKKSDVKLVISKLENNNIELANQLEDLGFRLKDIQQTHRFNLTHFDTDLLTIYNKEIDIVPFEPKHLEEIITLASKSFIGHGHYFANKRLDQKKCLEIYTDWAERSCLDKTVADKVFVALENKKVVGFLPFKILGSALNRYSISTLAAVDPEYRGKKIIKMLTVKGLEWGIENNLSWENHQILATNYSLIKALGDLGFRIHQNHLTFHLWL